MSTNEQITRIVMEQLYLDRNQTGDVTFLVESQEIHAHRFILADASPKYEADLYGSHAKKDAIRVPIVTAAAFEVFLQFFYKKSVDLTMDNIENVLHLAQQSLVDEFIESCINFLKKAIKFNQNLCLTHRLAKQYGSESLRLECEQRIRTNTKEVFDSADFLQCHRDMLLQILKMETLNCSEMDVFRACVAWAQAQCKRNHLDDGKPENLRAALGDAIYQIRFSSLTAKQFADLHRSLEGLFTADESIELFYITTNLKDFKPKKFIATARAPQNQQYKRLEMFDDENTFWSHEIDRFVHMSMRRTIENVEIGRVQFECDKPITLSGIALGVRFHEDDLDNFPDTLRIDTRFGRLLKDLGNAKYKIFQSSTRNDETMIIFERPMRVITSFSCNIPIPVKQLNYNLMLKPSVRNDGINFTFDCKWVTRIFYDQEAAFEGIGFIDADDGEW